MRIGIDTRLWDETGVGRYIRNLISNLQQIDKVNDYVLFVLSKDIENVKSQIANVKNQKWEIVIADVSWHSFEEQLQMPKILSRYNLDLVHFPYFSVPIMYSKPYVVTIHDLIIDHFPTGKASTRSLPVYILKRLFYKQIMNWSVGRAKSVIVPSNSTADELMEHYNISKNKIFVTYEGYEKVKRDGMKKISQNYFLYVGNAYPHKNIQKLLEAFCKFKNNTQNETMLYIVGRKDYFYKEVERIVDELNLKSYVKILEDVDDVKLSQLYSSAQALFSPSLMEGFGLTPLEAMNNKCLLALSDIPVFHEVCSEAAIYFDPQNVDDITKAMTAILSMSPKEKEQYLLKGVERAKNFSWEEMARKTLKIYESSLGIR